MDWQTLLQSLLSEYSHLSKWMLKLEFLYRSILVRKIYIIPVFSLQKRCHGQNIFHYHITIIQIMTHLLYYNVKSLMNNNNSNWRSSFDKNMLPFNCLVFLALSHFTSWYFPLQNRIIFPCADIFIKLIFFLT